MAPSGDVHVTVVADACAIAVNDGASGACAADDRSTGILNRGVVAVGDDGRNCPPPLHGNVCRRR